MFCILYVRQTLLCLTITRYLFCYHDSSMQSKREDANFRERGLVTKEQQHANNLMARRKILLHSTVHCTPLPLESIVYASLKQDKSVPQQKSWRHRLKALTAPATETLFLTSFFILKLPPIKYTRKFLTFVLYLLSPSLTLTHFWFH